MHSTSPLSICCARLWISRCHSISTAGSISFYRLRISLSAIRALSSSDICSACPMMLSTLWVLIIHTIPSSFCNSIGDSLSLSNQHRPRFGFTSYTLKLCILYILADTWNANRAGNLRVDLADMLHRIAFIEKAGTGINGIPGEAQNPQGTEGSGGRGIVISAGCVQLFRFVILQ